MSERTAPSDLPENIRRIVSELENEIGDDDPELTLEAAVEPIDGSNGKVEDAVRDILTEIGEDPAREGLLGTPDRVHRMYLELTAGYHVDPERLINRAVFDVDYS